MNPSDTNSALATLRQLKEMLDAGTLTPQEFEALKQKLVFGSEPPAATPPIAAVEPERIVPPPYPVVEPLPSSIQASVEGPSYSESAFAESPPLLVTPTPTLVEDSTPSDLPDETAPSGPLNLIFAIGGVLVLLAVVLYLTLGGRTADEHVTSTSQTAADSTATVPEVGPQTAQLNQSSAAPETIRTAPAVPRVAATPATTLRADSAVAAPAPSAPVKATPTPSAPIKTTPAAAPASSSATPADSTTKAGQP